MLRSTGAYFSVSTGPVVQELSSSRGDLGGRGDVRKARRIELNAGTILFFIETKYPRKWRGGGMGCNCSFICRR